MDCLLLLLAAGLAAKVEYTIWRERHDRHANHSIFNCKLADAADRPDDRRDLSQSCNICEQPAANKQACLEAGEATRKKAP